MSRWPALIGAALLAGLFTVATGPGAQADDDAPVDRKIKDGRITESSGLAASLLHPGVLWTHNDSGNPPRIYAIDPDGSTAATLTLRSEPNVDWEAITSLRSPSGQALIAVGDIGDNNAVHPNVRIAIVPEPRELRTTSVSPERVLRLRYPDGARDAEALLADPRTGRLYIASKTLFGSELYAVPKSLWPQPATGAGRVSRLTTLTKVATMSAGLITDGVFLPDGRILLRGYGRVFVMDRPEAVRNGRLATLATATLPAQDQGESITVTDGGKQALIGSEGRREAVLRIAVPSVSGAESESGSDGDGSGSGDAIATLPPDPAPAATASGGTAASGTAAAEPAFVGVGNLRIWALVIGAAIAVVAVTFGWVLRPSRRR